jgi:hypothetical protein
VSITGRVQGIDTSAWTPDHHDGVFSHLPSGVRSRISLAGKLRELRRGLRCLAKTAGLHELDFHSGRCGLCQRPWSQLYPTDNTAFITPAQQDAAGTPSR